MSDLALKARVCELLQSWQPWQRRLWDLGTVLALREAVEAARWTERHVISQAATSWYIRQSLQPRLGADAALGDGGVRRHLNEVCKNPVKHGSRNQRTLALLADTVADGYLARWRSLIASGQQPHTERAARCIAAHMLDLGFHQDHLYRAVKPLKGPENGMVDLIDLFLELEGRGEQEFVGMIVLQGEIPSLENAQKSPLWITREQVSTTLAALPDQEQIRATGGLRIGVRARDAFSAAQEMTEIFDRLKNRVRYQRGTGGLTAHPQIFIEGLPLPFSFLRGDPSVSIVSLEKAGVLYEAPTLSEQGSRVDDALELAAPLTGSSPSTAVAGAWAALESLLFCDTDEADREEGRAVAADRAAAIVAAAWPRAELTALSYKKDLSAADPRLRQELAAANVNRDRARIVMSHVAADDPFSQASAADAAALDRMRALNAEPHAVLNRVNGYLRGAFRRLYRQRNIVLHGGSTRSVALRASVRTAGPLVGAALDRIAYAYTTSGTTPLDLASRAQLALKLTKASDGWPVHELLGT